MRQGIALAVAGIVVGVGVGVGLMSTSGSQLSEATVGGRNYTVAFARSLQLDPTTLVEYKEATIAELAVFESRMTYRIEGVDPANALVLLLAPGQTDDAGDIGRYVLLVHGPDPFSALCPYFDPQSEATPRACQKTDT